MSIGPAPPRGLARHAVAAPVRLAGHALGWLRGAPRWLQLLLAAGVLLGGGVGGGYGYTRWSAGRAHRAAAAGWKKFEEAARTADAAGMDAALDAVLTALPGEPTAAARKHTLATGEAADHDRAMIAYAMRRNLRANDLPGAEREADKWLTHQPKDWLARLRQGLRRL